MFNIDFLLIGEIKALLSDKKEIRKKAEMLIDLIEFEKNFPDYSEKISDFWYENTEERFDGSDCYIGTDDRKFILEYAEKTSDLAKTKKLINKLCSLSDGVYSYDEVIADATNEISLIADISDFEFSDSFDINSENKRTQKPRLSDLLTRKIN